MRVMQYPRAAEGRPTSFDDQTRLMVRIARLYHEHGLKQADIARELHVSQPRVSRLLKRAAEVGIVRTTVAEPAGVFTALERALEERFGITEAVVVDTGTFGDEARALGSAAAAYLEATLTGGDRVGISSWSATLLAMVESLRPFTGSVVSEVVQLVGGVGQSQVQVQANTLLTQFAAATGAEPIFLPAPGVVGGVTARRALMEDATVSEVAARWRNLTTVLVGIGAIEPSPLLRRSGNTLAVSDLEALSDMGAVGDVCLRYFNSEGELVSSDFDDRVIGVDPSELRAVPRRIAVAGGERKYAAIRGALKGGWVNVLVTDVNTARLLVDEA